MEIISRKEAKEQGLKKYFTGIPCKNRHVAERYVSGHRCVKCLSEKCTKYYDKTRKTKNKPKRHYASYGATSNKERCSLYYVANKEKILLKQKEYNQINKELCNAQNAKRRARKKQALPKWADLEKIKEIYKNCPEGMHVDHIIPLQNDLVCGLHVENNLQYLTPKENCKKGNKYEI